MAYDPRAQPQFSPGTPMFDPRASAGQNISGMAQGRAPMNPASRPQYQMGRQALMGANNMRQQRQTQVPGTFRPPQGPAPFRQQFGGGMGQAPPPSRSLGGLESAAQRRFPMATSFQRQGQEAHQMQQQRQMPQQQMQQQPQQMQQRGIPQDPQQASQLGWSIGSAIRQLLDQMGTGVV